MPCALGMASQPGGSASAGLAAWLVGNIADQMHDQGGRDRALLENKSAAFSPSSAHEADRIGSEYSRQRAAGRPHPRRAEHTTWVASCPKRRAGGPETDRLALDRGKGELRTTPRRISYRSRCVHTQPRGSSPLSASPDACSPSTPESSFWLRYKTLGGRNTMG